MTQDEVAVFTQVVRDSLRNPTAENLRKLEEGGPAYKYAFDEATAYVRVNQKVDLEQLNRLIVLAVNIFGALSKFLNAEPVYAASPAIENAIDTSGLN